MSIQQEFLTIINPYTCFSNTKAQTGPSLCFDYNTCITLHGMDDILTPQTDD